MASTKYKWIHDIRVTRAIKYYFDNHRNPDDCIVVNGGAILKAADSTLANTQATNYITNMGLVHGAKFVDNLRRNIYIQGGYNYIPR